MSVGPMERTVQRLRLAAQGLAAQDAGHALAAPPGDAELLDRFIARQDEAAFAALVRRHAAMVLGVCRRVIGDVHDAEDAFQAVFCLLLLKAQTIRRREVLGSWLYGVAYRTALAAKARRAKTRRREHSVDVMPHPSAPPPETNTDTALDWQPLLDAALERLPDKYRAPIVLCDLEGKTRKQAAAILHVAEGTLSSRLARGRGMLARRLARQGLALSSGTLAAMLASEAAAVTAPAPLVGSVIQAGTQFITSRAAAGAFTASVLSLAHGVNKAMLIGKLKTLAAVVVVAALAFGGRWFIGGQATAQPPPEREAAPDTGGIAPPGASVSPRRASAPNALPLGVAPPKVAPRNVPHGKEYRVELTINLPDGTQPNPMLAPRMTVPLGQRLPLQIDVLVRPAKDAEVRPAHLGCEVEVLRERGADVLVNFRLERKDRGTDAIVRGKSLEFEEFVALNSWKEINDPALGGMTAKLRVTAAKVLPNPVPAAVYDRSLSLAADALKSTPLDAAAFLAAAAAQPRDPKRTEAGKEPDGAAADSGPSLRLFPLKHLKADDVLRDIQKLLGTGERAFVVPQANGILIQGGERSFNSVAKFLNDIDVVPPQPKDAADSGASAVSPDGQRLAVAAGSDVVLFDTRTGKVLAKNRQATGVRALAFSPDGKLIASGTVGGSAALLDSATGQTVRQAKVSRPVVMVVFAPGGAALIIATDNGEHVLDLMTGVLRETKSAPQK